MLQKIKNWFRTKMECPIKENEYTTVEKLWKYWRRVYIDFWKQRAFLETQKKEKFFKQIDELDFSKAIYFLEEKGLSNKSFWSVKELMLVWVNSVEDLKQTLNNYLNSSDSEKSYVKIDKLVS